MSIGIGHSLFCECDDCLKDFYDEVEERAAMTDKSQTNDAANSSGAALPEPPSALTADDREQDLSHSRSSEHFPAPAQPTPKAITENDLYYLRSIQRQIQMVKESLDDSISLSLGVMAFADNLDWLDCFIDAHERNLAAKATP